MAINSIYVKDSAGTWNNLLSVIYPVGSFYFTNTETSPATTVGGTWVKLVDCLLGSGMVYPAGYSGSFTITTNELPSHKHGMHTDSSGNICYAWGSTVAHSTDTGNNVPTESQWEEYKYACTKATNNIWSAQYCEATGGGAKHIPYAYFTNIYYRTA